MRRRIVLLALLFGLFCLEAQAAMPDAVQVGAPLAIENLTVFPILASQGDAPAAAERFVTLDAALDKKRAVVEEREGGGQVASLSIQNRGDQPIYVLAGTIVKGGKQDRLVSQDFVVPPGQTIAVDAFCVEQGRWNERRAGKTTQGRFGALKQLAGSRIRAASQHEKDQGKVWRQVARTNEDNRKSAETGTLMATLDDNAVKAARERLLRASKAALRTGNFQQTVGIGYAIDGDVRGVRWFENHDLFETFEDFLLGTAAVDAITARKGGAAKPAPAMAPKAVDDFVADIEAAAEVEERDTAGSNRNEYKRSQKGYGSKTRLKHKASEKPLSHDYVKREPEPAAPAPNHRLPLRRKSQDTLLEQNR